MGASGIYTRLLQVTEKHLGCRVNPHLFRDAAATFIAETGSRSPCVSPYRDRSNKLATTTESSTVKVRQKADGRTAVPKTRAKS
jgi:hypothetical protein